MSKISRERKRFRRYMNRISIDPLETIQQKYLVSGLFGIRECADPNTITTIKLLLSERE